MTNPNQELLSWAVENIKVWDNDYTHLRSDNLENPFYSTGCWSNYKDLHWVDPTDGENEYVPLRNKIFSTDAPQVIPKEEWLHAKTGSLYRGLMETPTTSSSEPLTGHVHAELMAEYALVAKTNPEPWKEFEVLNSEAKGWEDLEMNPRWFAYAQYRRKPTPPKTMNIGGVIVEAWPLDHMPSAGLSYWALVVEDDAQFSTAEFINDVDNIDEAILYTGKAFSTKEQAQAVADALNLVYNRAIGREE